MRVTIIGTGYVGLVTGACLAHIGHQVTCTDSDLEKIAILQAGGLPHHEPFLERVVAKNCAAGRLAFTTDPAEAVNAGDLVLICVGTPPRRDGAVDLSAIAGVARLIAESARNSKLVVEKSTVPARTGQNLKKALTTYGRRAGLTFSVASNPEFLRESTAVNDFLHPDRIVVGVQGRESEEALRELYHPVLVQSFTCPVHERCPAQQRPVFISTSIETAELIKHASNSFLAVKISFINAIADLCERVGADVEEVARAIGLDRRIGQQFLQAGLGFGGFCLPKDIQAFVRLADEVGVNFGILKEAEKVNTERIECFLNKLRHALWVIRSKRVAVLGLAFKPNTDDLRLSPAIALIERLLEEGAEVIAYDPFAMEKGQAILPVLEFAPDPYSTAEGVDALVLATGWPAFRELDWGRIGRVMNRALVLDGRNFLDPVALKGLGFEYYSMGRPQYDGPAETGRAKLAPPGASDHGT